MPAGNNITIDGELLQTPDNSYTTQWSGNDWSAYLQIQGTFDGADVTLSVKQSGANGSFLPVLDGGVFTDNVAKVLRSPHKMDMKLTVANAGGATDISWNLL